MPFRILEAGIAVSQPILNRNVKHGLYAEPTTASIRNWTYILFRQKPGKARDCGGRDLNPGLLGYEPYAGLRPRAL
jgi:hypothetical protein